MKKSYLNLCLLVVIALFAAMQTACKKDPVVDDPGKEVPALKLTFVHHVDGQPAKYDTTMYINAVGNHYQINQIQYFISDITLHKVGGAKHVLTGSNELYYVDKDIASTLSMIVTQKIPPGQYEKISFTFGINEQKNQSLMFVDYPESAMFWPQFLGGGYHYLKLNMKHIGPDGYSLGNAFHLGIGQLTDANDSIIGFVQNYFEVNLPNSSFTITEDKTTNVQIVMNVENWFQNPNVYDFDYWGGDIMQNQDAMAAAAANGHDVFSCNVLP